MTAPPSAAAPVVAVKRGSALRWVESMPHIRLMLALYLFSSAVDAAPRETFLVLQRQPITALEYGMSRLRDDLNPLEVSGAGHMSVSIYFDEALSRLRISASSSRVPQSDDVAKTWCSNAILRLRDSFAFLRKTGRPVHEGTGSTLWTYFASDRVKPLVSPGDLAADLDTTTRLEATILPPEPSNELFRCEGSLLGTDILHSE